MIERYSTPQMTQIWSEENKIKAWLDVEILTVSAFVNLGEIPHEDLVEIKKNIKIDIKRMKEIELETRHDVVAFTRMLSESLGEEKKWVHYGLTSTDVVDTAQNFLIKQSNEVLIHTLANFMNALKSRALEHKMTPIMGRTHGVHAEPTTLGLKFAQWYEEMKRNIERFTLARKQIEVGKISGAVGTFCNVDPKVEASVCYNLGLGIDKISTQIISRDRHMYYLNTLAQIATTIEKIAMEIRGSQRTEISELAEGFAKGQKGSSAMPHKKNPILCENLCGLARLVKGNASVACENVALWQERDISHSSNERIIIPDTLSLVDFMLTRMTNVIENLQVNIHNIKRNMDQGNELFYSQKVLLTIIDIAQTSREEAYDFVQKCTLQASKENRKLSEILIENNVSQYLNDEQFKSCFDLNYYLKNVDHIFNRVFDKNKI